LTVSEEMIVQSRLKWTLGACAKEAKKYNSIKDWQIGSAGSYNAAFAKGWLDKCCTHMERKLFPKNYCTLEHCMQDAMQYKTKSEWCSVKRSGYSIASKYFKIPTTLTSFKLGGVTKLDDMSVVAKSFTSGLTTTNKTLMTTAVAKEALHPDYPWFLQELIPSNADITVFICGSDLFSYSRDRSNLKGLDWRAEQDFTGNIKEWNRFELSKKDAKSVFGFCKELQVDWGRMDLMMRGDDLVFLEFNANGQWVFLDYSGEDRLVKTVAKYLIS